MSSPQTTSTMSSSSSSCSASAALSRATTFGMMQHLNRIGHMNDIYASNSQSMNDWVVHCKALLIKMECTNIQTRSNHWTSIVNQQTQHTNHRLNINTSYNTFKYNVDPLKHLTFLCEWKGLKMRQITNFPRTYTEFEAKAKNWLNGRRAPNYGATLFPDMIKKSETYARNLADKLFDSDHGDNEICEIYFSALMYSYLAALCSERITMNNASKRTPLLLENSLKYCKTQTAKMLQNYAQDYPYPHQFPSHLRQAADFFQTKYDIFMQRLYIKRTGQIAQQINPNAVPMFSFNNNNGAGLDDTNTMKISDNNNQQQQQQQTGGVFGVDHNSSNHNNMTMKTDNNSGKHHGGETSSTSPSSDTSSSSAITPISPFNNNGANHHNGNNPPFPLIAPPTNGNNNNLPPPVPFGNGNNGNNNKSSSSSSSTNDSSTNSLPTPLPPMNNQQNQNQMQFHPVTAAQQRMMNMNGYNNNEMNMNMDMNDMVQLSSAQYGHLMAKIDHLENVQQQQRQIIQILAGKLQELEYKNHATTQQIMQPFRQQQQQQQQQRAQSQSRQSRHAQAPPPPMIPQLPPISNVHQDQMMPSVPMQSVPMTCSDNNNKKMNDNNGNNGINNDGIMPSINVPLTSNSTNNENASTAFPFDFNFGNYDNEF